MEINYSSTFGSMPTSYNVDCSAMPNTTLDLVRGNK
jgi:hypothetical protein